MVLFNFLISLNYLGLSTRLSRSTAYDVAKLCITCLENK
jgi:hypothetical protein